MQIILLEKVINLGGLGDVVKVKEGYARNYLIPHGKAKRATVCISAAATGLALASPARSPWRTSRHHCRRISPGIGSRARSRTLAISMLNA